MAVLPATGSAITFTNVRKGFANVTPTAGSNVALRGTLGASIGVSTGSISLSARFGGRTTPFNI